ncbi:exonuclease domain-containing protein [Aquimarina intermedia]|uniref:DNA polymerase-3 subunit epsilon n=1 Tax=Aquimarina intermedia TaxID=350814 RepID=A0A5S5BUG7_9FLAO|nr:exonuclease domain-containing protein [Aquimarina intermedia]TYP69978.1 DNA polymerase-3 subunit epsilon [Aquimarina intermedia]
MEQRYAVIDVETTGKGINGNRITEICIVLLEGKVIRDKYTTLVNPDQHIPNYITGLTGIDNDLVHDAPAFDEIAARILEITEGAIFVAHNVSFDYNVVRNEFKAIGHNFVRKKLCTVRLSRKIFPGLYSYSLGNLCTSLNIQLKNRHRAEGDTDATVVLFQKILEEDPDLSIINSFLNIRSKQATLPPHLKAEQIEALPASPGIYLFKDQKEKIIYAGKAKNIKQRVISHFYDKKNKEYLLGQKTHTIDYEVTGNELIALLLEAEMIRKHYPEFNTAQKKPVIPFHIISYTNRRGVLQLAIDQSYSADTSIEFYYSRADAIAALEELCISFELCPRYCNLQQSTARCSHYKIKSCKGVCSQEEAVEAYNLRVQKAMESSLNKKMSYIIKEKGRTGDEQSFVLVKDGMYRGYGFIDETTQVAQSEDFEEIVRLQTHTYHTSKIITSYIRKRGDEVIIPL